MALAMKGSTQKFMLRIQRSAKDRVVFSLSGRIEIEDVAELQRLFRLEAVGQAIALDLQDVTLVDREAVSFLACCEMERIALDNCPAYIREWIVAEKGRSSRQKQETA
jgi:hypothetical protein